jgi:hypothetical protein
MLMLKTTLSLLMFQLSTTRWKHYMELNLKGNLQSAQRSFLIKTLGVTKMFSINYDCFNQLKKSSNPNSKSSLEEKSFRSRLKLPI